MHIDVSIEDARLLPILLESSVPTGIAIPGERLEPGAWRQMAERIQTAGKSAIFSFPYIFRKEAGEDILKHREQLQEAHFDGFLIRTLDEAAFLRELGLPGERIFDASVYTWNQRAKKQMKALGADVVTLPVELNREEVRSVQGEDSCCLIYGRLPLMVSAQCSKKTVGNCRKSRHLSRDDLYGTAEYSSLADRKKTVFREAAWCRYCYSVIYNSVPLWLLDRVPQDMPRVRFMFTDETPEEASSVLRAFETGRTDPPAAFTRGHFTRGVE